MIHDYKPPLDEALLMHYGVKGMKWGIINEDESSGRQKTPRDSAKENASTKEYMAIARKNQQRPSLSPKDAAKSLAENQQKFAEKFMPSEDESKKD